LGSIEAGKLADFFVMKKNLFDLSRYNILQAAPIAVCMDGELVYGNL
jgi:predicted amidohydrolase YtcJ